MSKSVFIQLGFGLQPAARNPIAKHTCLNIALGFGNIRQNETLRELQIKLRGFQIVLFDYLIRIRIKHWLNEHIRSLWIGIIPQGIPGGTEPEAEAQSIHSCHLPVVDETEGQ